MLPIRTPAVRARLLGQSDGWVGRPANAEQFKSDVERAAYLAAWDKHHRMYLDERRRLSCS